MKRHKAKDYTRSIKYICKDKEFKDEFHKWNFILRELKQDVIQVQKANRREEEARKKHRRSGVPNWAKGKC